jgi:peptide/nickel transport system substrate-binding protein
MPERTRTAPWIRTLAVLVAVGALLAPAASAQETPRTGGVIRVPIATQPTNFNPLMPSELASTIVYWTIFNALTVVSPHTNQLEPMLAERWEANEDVTSWTFHLRTDVTWHDGEPFTADDVKFTFDRIRDEAEGSPNISGFRLVTDVVVVDESTVRVDMSAPDVFFPDRMALGGNEIIPEHLLSGFARLADAVDFNTLRPIGTGPFKMQEAVPGQYFELVANEDYFKGRPYLDGITFRIVPDANTRVTELLAGQLDWVDIIPSQLPAVRGNSRVQVNTFDSLGYQIFAWNLLDERFQDVRVREAFMYGIDRRTMLQAVSPGLGYVDDVFIPLGISWIERPADLPFREFDPERARALLAEAGWTDSDGDGILDKDGEKFAFKILVDRGDTLREQMGLIIQQYLTELGMEVEYDLAERGGRWLEETQQRTFQTRLASFPVTNVDWLRRLYTTSGQNNGQSYSSPEVDALFERLARTPTQAEQAELFGELNRLLYADPPNMVLLFSERMTASNVLLRGLPNHNIKDSMTFAHEFWLAAP